MAEQGVTDPLEARQRAASRHAGAHGQELPEPAEIAAALHAHLALFHAERHRQLLRTLRERALAAMRLCAPFRPRLVGAVLDGSAVPNSPVVLHLLDTVLEELLMHLLERRIAYRLAETSVRYGPQQARRLPLLRLRADDVTLELVVFPPDGPRQPPLCPLTGRQMQRAAPAGVAALLQAAES